MSQSISIIAAAAIVALGGIALVWWWTGRPTRARVVRTLLRVVSIPVFAGLAVGVVFATNQTTAGGAAAAAQPVVPSERMTVANGTLTVSLNATGALTPAHQETLSFDVSAPVTEVLVAVGDRVKAGDVLARIDSSELDAQVRSAEFTLTDAQNALNTLQEPPTDLEIEMAKAQVQAAQASLSSSSLDGPSSQDIEIARLNVELAKNSLWQAQVNRDVSESRPGAGQEVNAYSNDVKQAASLANSDNSVAVAQSNYDATLNEGPNASGLASGNASLLSAEANLNTLMAGASESDIRKAEIKVEMAKLAVDAASTNLDQTVLTAPYDGVVASLDFVTGTQSAGESITLIDTSGYTITLSVDEKDITQLKVGQAVSLQVQALGDAAVPGTVTRIDPAPVESTSGQLVTYNVEVTLNSSDQPLRPGMSAIATVTLEQVSNVMVVPNRFITVNAATQEATVKVATSAGTYQDIPVTLGKRTDSESEVVSGLILGQTLVILPTATQTTQQQGFSLLPGGGVPGAGGGNFAGGPPGGGNGGGRPGG